jgi:hypothetical protein
MDPAAKRISRLRTLVAVMGVAAVVVGVGSYLGVSSTESNEAKNRFTSIVEAAVDKLEDNVKNYDLALRLLAQTYVEMHPTLADWPTAVLPNFYNSAQLVKEIAGADMVGFAVHVKPEDVSRYEAFIIDYWDKEPSIPPNLAGYAAGASGNGERGVWAINDTSNGFILSSSMPYHGETYNFSLSVSHFSLSRFSL